jgi:GalNAc-alpha-(1->4)-GalNAc-alpha-(1->3)-diNAcBac-PP-undecaprenol alpha-1,4-N-acetyl-D-galactosaminyltransferase
VNWKWDFLQSKTSSNRSLEPETGASVRIAFVISTVAEAGGAQRVAVNMMNYWAKKGWEIDLITSDDGFRPPFYELHPSVRCVATDDARPYAGPVRALFRNLARVLTLRKVIKRTAPTCLIAIGDIIGIRAILATLNLQTPVLVAEHLDPAQLSRMKNGQAWATLRSCLYPLADRVVVLNESCKDYFSDYIKKKIAVIPNAVPEVCLSPDEAEQSPEVTSHNAIVTLGRLVPQKRFDLLLRAFSAISRKINNNLIIVGEGPLRGELEALSRGLGLSGRVKFTGLMRRPWAFLKDAEFFVMSSEFEGFPMTLLEAMACGVPVISFDCRTGPGEIIRDGIDGILVPPLDVGRLADEMERLATDHSTRQLMAKRALEVRERFSTDTVMAEWESLVHNCRRLQEPVA